jgi:hypothetical protein
VIQNWEAPGLVIVESRRIIIVLVHRRFSPRQFLEKLREKRWQAKAPAPLNAILRFVGMTRERAVRRCGMTFPL